MIVIDIKFPKIINKDRQINFADLWPVLAFKQI